MAEEDSKRASDKTVASNPEADQPAKPGRLARLRTRLAAIKLPLRKKGKPDEEEGPEPSVEHADEDHRDEEPEPPAKPGLFGRLKGVLAAIRREKNKPDNEEAPESPEGRADKNQPDEESEPPAALPAKHGKWRPLVLALLILLAAGGGFTAREWLLPPQQQKMQPPVKSAPLLPAVTISHPPAKAQTDASATAGREMRAQIETLKKQNQEMREQLEALKKQSKQPSPVASTPPREGVLIISGKEAKESAQGLKKVIEEMNAASESRGARKPAK